MDLVLSAKGSESTSVSYDLLETTTRADDEEWIEKTFIVGSDFDGKDLALVALHFTNAQALNLYLGEFSIVRGTAATPAQPEITSASLLYNSKSGYDGKVIFNMANDKAAGEPCYNLDVKTSYFHLYTQQEGQDPVLMGATTSWAGLIFSAPVVGEPTAKMRIGVSAVSLDHKSESAIAWSEYLTPATYVYNDDIQIDKTTIKPNEKFTLSYVDPRHEDGTWVLYDESGNQVYSGTGRSVTVEDGMPKVGNYTLKLTGTMHDGSTTTTTTREYLAYVQVSGENIGALPEIYTLTANGSEEPISIKVGDAVNMAYTARSADGMASRGIDMNEKRFGAKCADLDLVGTKSFSVSFWLKINELASGQITQLLSVANKLDSWPKTDWGWIWTGLSDDGTIESFTFRGTDATSNNELRYRFDNTKLPVGTWMHIAFVFDYNTSGNLHCDFYVNGQKQEVTSWNRSTGTSGTSDPGYQENVYKITSGQVLAVGGDAYGRAGIKGALDNLMVWDGAITADDVAKSMGEIDANNLPSNVISFWSFEGDASTDNTFTSAGSKSVQAGAHTYETGEGEGQGYLVWQAPSYTAGCPFISGEAYKVETLPTWRAPKAVVTNATGNSTAGSATLTYDKAGDRLVYLTLSNALGSDQRTFNIIHISADGTGVDAVETGDVKTFTVGEEAIVEFGEAGNYEVRVFNLNGQAEAAESATVAAGATMHIRLAQAGIYMVQVKKDGQQVRTVKLVRK